MARDRYKVTKDDQPPVSIQEAQVQYYPEPAPEGFMYVPVNPEQILGCARCGLITIDWEEAVEKHNEWHTLLSDFYADFQQFQVDAKQYVDGEVAQLRQQATGAIGSLSQRVTALENQ